MTIYNNGKEAICKNGDKYQDEEGELLISTEAGYYATYNAAKATITISPLNINMYTIPANTDIYTYSSNTKAIEYDKANEQIRRNEKRNTSGRVYFLDEVLYLISNENTLNTVVGEDLNFDSLELYGLRRDGTIIYSTTLNNYAGTKQQTEISLQKFNIIEEEGKEVFANICKEKSLNTQNFIETTTDYNKNDLTIGERNVLITYTNNEILNKNAINTNIKINIIDIPVGLNAEYKGKDIYIGDSVSKDDVVVKLEYASGRTEETTDYIFTDDKIKHTGENIIEISYTNDNKITTNIKVNGINRPIVNKPTINLNKKEISIVPGEIQYDELDSIYYSVTQKDDEKEEIKQYSQAFSLENGEWIVKAYQVSKTGIKSEIAERICNIKAEVIGIRAEAIKDVYKGYDLTSEHLNVYYIYDDKTETKIDNYETDYNKEDLTLGEREITVNSDELNCKVTINVIEKPIRKTSITGVLKYSNEKTISNKLVKLNDVQTSTNENGKFIFENVEEGEYVLTVDDAKCTITIGDIDNKTKDKIEVNSNGIFKILTEIKDDVFTINGIIKVPEYKVRFLDNEGKILKTEIVEEGKSATAPSADKTGYKFIKWDKAFDNIVSNLDVTAIYEKNKYTVKFVNYNDDVLKEQIVEYLDNATAPQNPTRTGYNFVKWDKEFTKIKENLTIKAVFEEKTYTIKFVDYNDEILKTQTVKYKESAQAPKDPTRDGHKFIKWDKDFTNIESDLVVKALYEQIIIK